MDSKCKTMSKINSKSNSSYLEVIDDVGEE
jgi:hypothetical protein